MISANTIYKDRLKPKKEFFETCYNSFPVYRYKNNQYDFIASDRKSDVHEVKYRSNLKMQRYSSNRYFGIILATEKRIEVQIYSIYHEINPNTMREQFHTYLVNMEQWLSSGKHHKITYYNDNNYRHGLSVLYGGMSGHYTGVNWYCQDYEQVFSKSILKYIKNINSFISQSYYGGMPKVIGMIVKYNFGIQALQKLNAHHLVDDIIFDKADMRKITKRFILERKDLLKNNNLSYKQLIIIDYMKSKNIPVVIKAIDYIDIKALDTLPKEVSYVKIQNYLLKQQRSLSYYNDYIGMLRDLDISLNKESILYPKDLTLAHNEQVHLLKLKKLKVNEEHMHSITNDLEKLEYSNGILSVVCPKSIQDIIYEGNSLEHCVGSSRYLEGHVNREFAIMFVRKANDLSKSLYTFTYYYDMSVDAIHGYANRDLENAYYEPVKDFLNEWLKWVKHGCKKQPNMKKRRLRKGDTNVQTQGSSISIL